MLKAMHKYRKSLFGILLIALVCMTMTGFGLEMLNRRPEPYAIRIGEHSISYEQFNQERRQLEERYRSIFGNNFQQMAQQLNLNLSQQAVDKAINDHLIEREAAEKNLVVGDESVASLIRTALFGNRPFDANAYRGFLRQAGVTTQQFEASVRSDALRQQYLGLLRVAATPSDNELRQGIIRDETTYNVSYVEFDPAQFQKELVAPDAAALEAFYAERSEGYELPPRISYDYVVLDPKKFLDLVEVTPEDIELFYADNQHQFTNEEQIQARHVQLNYSKDATPAEMASLKTRAEEVHQRAVAGEPFEMLALEYSDDITSKGNGGDLGWLSRGRMAKEFDAAAFKAKQGGVAELVQTDYGFHVVKVEGHKEAAPKDLSEVRAEIERIIRDRESPAYTSEKAATLFDAWSAKDQSLADFAVENNLVAVSTNGLMDREKDPEDGLRGLTGKVITFPEEAKQMVDVGDKSVLVSVKQYRDAEIPPLEQVRERVIEDWKKQQAQRSAKEAAEKLLAALKDGSQGNLSSAAAAAKVQVKDVKDVSLANRGRTPPLNDEALQRDFLKPSAVGQSPERVYEVGGKFILAQATAATRPDAAKVDSKVAEYRRRATDSFLQMMAMAEINRLKARSNIDVAPGLLAQDS